MARSKGFINPLELLTGGAAEGIPEDLKLCARVTKRSLAASVCSRYDLLWDALCHWECKDALKLSWTVRSSAY